MDPLQQLFRVSSSLDPCERLQVSLNPDGSLTRRPFFSTTSPSLDPNSPFPSLSKDIPLNPSLNTSLRLFLPKSSAASSSSSNNNNKKMKLPVILYFHGGGFILLSPSVHFSHDACSQRAAHIPALVVSLDYRLAPEHRLPSAYEDALEALLWIQNQANNLHAAEPWMRDHADFSRCFLMGTSAGANIAYHSALRSLDLNLDPLTVAGLILNQPYFGGVERTESEERSKEDVVISLAVNDFMWELSLPVGVNRDHEYCNPLAPPYASGKVKSGLPKCLVKGFVGDPLYDRQKLFVEMLREEGVEVVDAMEDHGFHGIEIADPSKAAAIVEDCRKFIGSLDDEEGGVGGSS